MQLGISAMLYILNPYIETFQADFQNYSDATTNCTIKDLLITFVRSFAEWKTGIRKLHGMSNTIFLGWQPCQAVPDKGHFRDWLNLHHQRSDMTWHPVCPDYTSSPGWCGDISELLWCWLIQFVKRWLIWTTWYDCQSKNILLNSVTVKASRHTCMNRN